jgi:hypothetical protein
VFDTSNGAILQNYVPFGDSSGSYGGITYSSGGKYLLFSQDSSNVHHRQCLAARAGEHANRPCQCAGGRASRQR